VPVLNESIQVFKKPPEYGAGGEQKKKKPGMIEDHASSGLSLAECIDDEDI
jgi:hypothetical protein